MLVLLTKARIQLIQRQPVKPQAGLLQLSGLEGHGTHVHFWNKLDQETSQCYRVFFLTGQCPRFPQITISPQLPQIATVHLNYSTPPKPLMQ